MNYQARMIRIINLVVARGVLSNLSGYSWMTGSFEGPDVKPLEVKVIKTRLLGQESAICFHINNPNDFSLPVRGLQYTVQLNDIQLAKGESGQWFTVPTHDHKVFDIPTRASPWRHMKYIVKLPEHPEELVRYRLQGEVKTGLIFGRSVYLRRNGEIIPGDLISEWVHHESGTLCIRPELQPRPRSSPRLWPWSCPWSALQLQSRVSA